MTDLFKAGGRPLLAILAAALVVRVAVAFWPVIHHPDELWQYLEPAHHIAVGPWIRSWEWRDGARSWLLPTLIAGPLWLGHALAPGSIAELVLPRLVMVAFSLLAVIGAAGLGFRLSRLHGLAAALVAALWYEFAYFGPRTMSEPPAMALILCAAWLLYRGGRRETMLAGLMLGLGCCLRFQYAPAALVLAAMTIAVDWARWRWLVVGGLAAALVSAAADGAMGAVPFAWIWRNTTLNIVDNKSAAFGVSGPFGLVAQIWSLWRWGMVPILVLAAIGARRFPTLMAVALVNLLVHSLIPHKEYRFVLLTTCLLVLLAAIGSVDLVRAWRWPRPGMILAGFWLALCIACAGLGDAPDEWGGGARLFSMWRIAGTAPGLCGAAIYRSPDSITATYALFHRDVPIYTIEDPAVVRRSRAFNVVVASVAHAGELTGYAKLGCPSQADPIFCVYRRPGLCVATPGDAFYDANTVLARTGH